MSKRATFALAILVGPLNIALYAADNATTTSVPSSQPANLLKPSQTETEWRAHLLPLVPKFETPTDADIWVHEAEKLRKRVIEDVVLRGVPESWWKSPTKVVWGDVIPGKGYKIKKLRYEVVPGFWAGALFYEPDKIKGLVPAIMNVNGHVGAEGMTIPYEQMRRINLAKRGMLALGLEWTGNGELSAPEYSHHGACYLELCGISGVSVHYLALKRGLDILLENEHADPDRVAVTGLSGGAWQTIFISSLDTRVKLAAPNAGYMANATRLQTLNDLGDEEQSPVDFGTFCDYVHLTAMLAPRPALLIANVKDTCCFQAARVKEFLFDPIRPVYELMGKPERFDFHANTDPGTHNYDKDNREAFYKFVNQNFLPKDQRKDDEIAVDDEVRTQAELAIDYPKPNGSFFKLAAEAMKSLPESKRPDSQDHAAVDAWRTKTREALRKVIRLPQATPKATGLPSEMKSPDTKDIETRYWNVKIGNEWTLPVVELMVAGSNPTLNKLIICDTGRTEVNDLIKEVLNQQQRVYVVDILSTGECASQWNSSPYSWLWSLITAELGERTLGLQVMQLKALTGWIKAQHPNLAIHAITRHRVSSMAALVYSAVYPGDLALVKMEDMDETMKVLMDKEVNTLQTQPIYCTGLLKVADIPELLDLANPTRAELAGH